MFGISTALLPFLAVIPPLINHAFALRRDHKYRQFWANIFLSAMIGLIAALYLDTDPEVPLAIRLTVLGFVGAAVGGAAVMWGG